MARELICPSCGQPVLVGSRDDLPAANIPLAAAQTIEVVIPGTASHDALEAPEVELASPVPPADPALGPYVYGDPAASAFGSSHSGTNGSGTHTSATSGSGSRTGDSAGVKDPAVGGSASPAAESPFDPHAELPDTSAAPSAAAKPAASPHAPADANLQGDVLSVLNFDGAPEPRLSSSSHEQQAMGGVNVQGERASQGSASASEDEFEYDTSRPGLAMIVLTSYASALTIALIWLVATGRVRTRFETAPPTIAADSRPDLEQTGSRAAARVAVEPIEPDHMTSLDKPLALGSLEITPLAVRTGPVMLERVAEDGSREERDAGADTLALRLRLRNTSKGEVFAPLDPSFVREHDRGLPDSFIEVTKDERIDIYPLAVYSEWAVAGQSFAPLAAGEERQVEIVSAPDALGRLEAAGEQPLVWRLRLRTAPDQTDLVGVRFAASAIEHAAASR